MTIKRGVRFLIVGVILGIVALIVASFESLPALAAAGTYVWLVAAVCLVAGLACAVVSAWRWTRR